MSGAQPNLTVASKLSGYIRAGGIITPLLTALIAFFFGGLVIAATGSSPFSTYKAIFEGSGLNWLFPWISSEDRTLAALNLQQTLILTTPLILTGMAVAYAFRAGLFNIGGQGQYFMGLYLGVIVGSSLEGLPGFLHIVLALVLGTLAGALWGGLAGWLKARTGANEVISTIMLNYVALWIGVWAFGLGGPLHSDDPANSSIPISNDADSDARLPVFWGDPELQGLHIGLFIAGAVLIVFWVLLNRSVAGYEARAVGFNPDAAEYGGIHAGRTYMKVMLWCGGFAGLAGAHRRARLAVRGRDERPPERQRGGRGVHRHRGRAAGSQHGVRRASSARCCSARCSTARRCATLIRRCSRPSWRRT